MPRAALPFPRVTEPDGQQRERYRRVVPAGERAERAP
jgi:hypothetical protein